MASKFKIHIHSTFAELWRYNIAMLCGSFDASGERIDFVSEQCLTAPVGANLKAAPAEAKPCNDMRITTVECDSIVSYVYIIPNTLPLSREISDCRPFDLKLKVWRGEEVIYDVTHKINQWSGASIELKLPKPIQKNTNAE